MPFFKRSPVDTSTKTNISKISNTCSKSSGLKLNSIILSHGTWKSYILVIEYSKIVTDYQNNHGPDNKIYNDEENGHRALGQLTWYFKRLGIIFTWYLWITLGFSRCHLVYLTCTLYFNVFRYNFSPCLSSAQYCPLSLPFSGLSIVHSSIVYDSATEALWRESRNEEPLPFHKT